MGIRTDLALEAKEMYSKGAEKTDKIDGVDAKVTKNEGITTTRIKILNENGERALSKPKGTYVTIEAPDIKYSTEVYEKACMLLAEEIRGMADIGTKTKTLVVGLGNKKITPDALGPDVISKLMVTNHMKEHMREFFTDDITSVCAIAPGVLGTTGMETAQIIKGVIEQIHPDLVICVDALASRSLDRISTTIQLADTGINPGAGVDNSRAKLDEQSLGVKVIAIGVPTVVDAATIASDAIDMAFDDVKEEIPSDEKKNTLIKEALSKNIKRLMVTPKDIDTVIEKASKTVANGINMALHKNLTFEDIESFVG